MKDEIDDIVEELIEKKKKVVKAKIDPEEKKFVNTCKLLFSSLSARAAQYAYFNVAKNTIILSNSTSSQADDHGDRIMDYAVGELSFHVLEIRDLEFYQKLIDFLKIPDGVYFCVHVVNMVSILGKFSLKELGTFVDIIGNTILLNKTRTTYDKKNIVGWPLSNFHVIKEIYSWYHSITAIATDSHRQQFPHLLTPVKLDPVMVGRVFFTEFDSTLYKTQDGVSVFNNMNPRIKIMSLDGLSIPSIKEFIKRVASEPFTFMQYTWVVDGSHILSMTLFENEMVFIRSIRPNILAVPLPALIDMTDNSIVMSHHVLTSVEE